DVRAVIQAGTEIGMQADRRTDEADDSRGIGIDGGCGDVPVPGIVGGEGKKAVQAGTLAKADVVASTGVAATTARAGSAAIAGAGASSDAATGDQQRKKQDDRKHHFC